MDGYKKYKKMFQIDHDQVLQELNVETNRQLDE